MLLETDFEHESVRVGVDLARVDEVAESLSRFGDRYLRRVFTPHEIECSAGPPAVAAQRLAARFAGKEAVLKVLRPTGARPDWRSIEIRRLASGATTVALSGAAAALARAAGISELAVSLTHEAGIAGAVVMATMELHEEDPT
jgi:holo-[acyl-carrier protein] synthase